MIYLCGIKRSVSWKLVSYCGSSFTTPLECIVKFVQPMPCHIPYMGKTFEDETFTVGIEMTVYGKTFTVAASFNNECLYMAS